MTVQTHSPTRRDLVAAFAAVLGLALPPLAAHAADTPAPPPPATAVKAAAPAPADKLAEARAQIAQKNWGGAIDALRRASDPGSADWNNLMGYSLRKNTPPDHAAAEKHYDEALRIAPAHRGALEYSGELALITGDLARAEQRLATLERVCSSAPCEELDDLKQAVARFKANGNKYVAEAR